MTRISPQARGFTLVEVLVSLAIFAMAAVVLGAAYLNVLTNYHAVRSGAARDIDFEFARMTLLAEPDRARAERGGQMAVGQGSLTWRAEIEPAKVPDLFEVTLECEFSDPGSATPRVQRQKFMLLRPGWSDPVERERLRAETREWLEKRKF
jgi:general secretion pathway protein I